MRKCIDAKKITVQSLLIIISLAATCLLPSFAKAQDINFSQFYELPLLRNPALAGLFEGDARATAVFRNQWNSVTVPYKTRGLGLEGRWQLPNKSTHAAAGLQVTHDVAGDSRLEKTSVMLTGAFHQDVGAGYVSGGVSAGAVWQNFETEGLRWDDQFVNGSYSPTNPTRQTFGNNFPTLKSYFDMAAGVTFNTELYNGIRYYIGAAGFHITGVPRTFVDSAKDDSKLKLMLNGGLSIPHGDFNRLIIYSDLFTQGGARQFQGGLLYKLYFIQEDADLDLGTSLSFGAFTRWGDAFIPMLKLDYYSFGIGATYDANISKLKSASTGRGGFEITASYRYFNKNKADIDCPRF